MTLPPFLDCDFFELTHLLRGAAATEADKLRTVLHEDFGLTAGVGMEEYFTHIEFCNAVCQELNIGAGRINQRYAQADAGFRRVLVAMLRESCEKRGCAYHQDIASRLEPGDTVISFNYDTVIDRALYHRAGNRWRGGERYGVEVCGEADQWTGTPTPGRPTHGSVKLLKLHGSTHWARPAPGTDCPPVSLEAQSYANEDPLIVPPAWNKGITRQEPFTSLWKEARRALRNARAMIVVGYSLPKTDILFRALLQMDTTADVPNKKKLVHLHIVNPNDDAVVRIRSALSRAVGHRTKLVRRMSFEEYQSFLMNA